MYYLVGMSSEVSGMHIKTAYDAIQEFIAHFRHLSTDFYNEYEVIFRGAVQDPEQWGSMIQHARNETIHLSLRSKPY